MDRLGNRNTFEPIVCRMGGAKLIPGIGLQFRDCSAVDGRLMHEATTNIPASVVILANF